MKIVMTDEFKEKAKNNIAGMIILLFVILLYGFAGGVEMGTIF